MFIVNVKEEKPFLLAIKYIYEQYQNFVCVNFCQESLYRMKTKEGIVVGFCQFKFSQEAFNKCNDLNKCVLHLPKSKDYPLKNFL